MKKRQPIIATLLSLAMVFGLCRSEVTVHTVMAQEVQEETKDESYGQEVKEGAENDNQEPQKSFEDVSGEEISETEITQLTEGDETEGSEDTKQPQEQEQKEEAQVQGIAEQPEEITEEQEIALLSASNLSNPRIEKDSGVTARQKVTWDCVWFGKYPQAEVVPTADSYTAVDKSILRNGDIIENSSLYSKLQGASGWDANNDITVDGNKYRRMKVDEENAEDGISYYNWSDTDTYHYFKYEPIKWRVLKVNGNQAFLLSDITLDAQRYNMELENITWETSTIRSWLNGYSASSNKQGNDYSSKNFIGSAFSRDERSVIIDTSVVNDDNISYGTEGGNNTTDKIFLLSESETYGNSAVPYGFVSSKVTEDEARRSRSSTYAKAMGIYMYQGNCYWWLRSLGSLCEEFPGRGLNAAYVKIYGDIYDHGNFLYRNDHGVRAALNLNLTSNVYTYAGTVCSDGTMQKENTGNSGDSSTSDSASNNGDTGNSGNIGNSGGNSKPNAPDLSKPSKNVPIIKKAPVKVTKITLSGISKKIAAGKKVNLTASVKPSKAANKKLTWKSSNKKIATVNSKGVVTMKKKSGGKSVTITATAKDGSKVKATYKITSMKGVVKKVAISGNKSVKAGKTLKLKAKVTASKKANTKLKWTSSNKKYASVSSSGKVKALKAGKGKKVKISAMATDGSGKKKTVTIKIR